MDNKKQKINVSETPVNLESELQNKGYKIERAILKEDEPIQCEKCMDENCFEFHSEGWFIEGEFYCGKHKAGFLTILKEIDEDVDKIKMVQEELIKKRLENSGL